MLFQPPLAYTDLIWERVSDTKLLLAWNKDMIVLAFRGTASFSNVFADLQVDPVAPMHVILGMSVPSARSVSIMPFLRI